MTNSVDFQTLIRTVKPNVDEEIGFICDEYDVDHSVRPLLMRGKRLRAAVLCIPLNFYGPSGIREDDWYLAPTTYRLAAAIELAHTASLIMDDVIDEDAERRGQPTLHTKIGRDKALMNSVGLLAIPYEIAAEHGSYFVKTLGETQRSMVRGVVTEMFKRPDLPAMALYDAIVSHKTGTLFSLAAQWGYHAHCSIVGKPVLVNVREHWIEYGRLVGVAMQVADDIADLLNADRGKKPLGGGSESLLLRALTLESLAKEFVDDLKTGDTNIHKFHLTYSDEGKLRALKAKLHHVVSCAVMEGNAFSPTSRLLSSTPGTIALMMLEEDQ